MKLSPASRSYFRRRVSGFTLIELLVVISIIAILASLAIPGITGAIGRAQMTQVLNNMRQIHLITTQHDLEGISTGDTTLGWPGDEGVTWEANMIESLGGDQNGQQELDKLRRVQNRENAVIVTNTKATSPNNTIFLHTSNWSGGNLDADAPLGESGFVVFRKGGDGAILNRRQAGNEEITGVMP